MAKKNKTSKTAGGNKPSVALVYGPSREAKKTPRRYRMPDNTWVGIGGEITIPATPPYYPKDRVIPECTPEQYKQLKHLTKLVTSRNAKS